jgi:hypothetical protein
VVRATALVALAACSSGATANPEEPAPGRYAQESTDPDYTPPADCAAAIADIRAAVDRLAPVIERRLAIFAPTVGRAETPDKPGAIVTLARNAVHLDDHPVDQTRLRQRLLGKVRHGVPLYIYAEGRAPASEILAIAGAAPPMAEVHLVVDRRDAPFPWEAIRPEPSARWAAKMFDEARAAHGDPEPRARLQAELMKTALGTCEAAQRVFAPVEASPGGIKARRLGPEILDAVEGCGCSGVDIAGLALAVPYVMSRWNTLGTVPLARARTMRFASGATAADLARALIPAASP